MTPEQRHRCMSHIRSRDTRPEMRVRKLAFAMGYRYRLCDKRLPGKPDLVFPRLKKVIFVHGCFWHGHTCQANRHRVGTNRAFWESKLERNKIRDRQVLAALWQGGWEPLVIWECETKDPEQLYRILSDFLGSKMRPPLPCGELETQHLLYGQVAEEGEDYSPGEAPLPSP